jgi:DNA recombination protein RmuC
MTIIDLILAFVFGTIVGILIHKILQQQKLSSLESELARFEERFKLQEENKIALLDAKEKFEDVFKAISAEALQQNNQSFLTLAQTAMGTVTQAAKNDFNTSSKVLADLVNPVKEALTKIDSKLGQVEQERVKGFSALDQQIKTLTDSNMVLRQEASNLSKALKAPSVRGRWGEMQLKRVVELAGMSEHSDFTEQHQFTGTDAAKASRPDLIVHLPSGGSLAIDAKAPINSYLEALEATHDSDREKKLKEHAQHVKGHLLSLSRKSYWSGLQNSPDFTILFLPGEVFFSAALEQDPSLLEYGMDQKIILATPTTLLAMLKAVSYGWRQESLTQNAKEISELGSNLYLRLSKFIEHLDQVGDGIKKSVSSYNKALASLEARVLPSARKLKELGASAGEEIVSPETITEDPRRSDLFS